MLRLNPQPGERILDLSTGTGWTSRVVARRGAIVTGVDIAGALLEAARARAKAETLPIDYHLADAESLPFHDGQFDAVVSTFGIMFASRPEFAAAELARVCRKGGRIALTTWLSDSTLFEMFEVMRRYMPPPPTPAPRSPFDWGRTKRIRQLLEGAFIFDSKRDFPTTVSQAAKPRGRRSRRATGRRGPSPQTLTPINALRWRPTLPPSTTGSRPNWGSAFHASTGSLSVFAIDRTRADVNHNNSFKDAMTKHLARLTTLSILVFGLQLSPALVEARTLSDIDVPPVPATIKVPAGHSVFFAGHAIGTQNFICLATGAGIAWRFTGPQADVVSHAREVCVSAVDDAFSQRQPG